MRNQVEQARTPTLVTGMRINGFTLIEILVVILIVGITLSFALIAFGDFGQRRRVLVSADQFKNYVQLVQQQAILDSSILGIHIKQNSYQVYQWSASGAWSRMPSNRAFHEQHALSGVVFHYRDTPSKPGVPQIMINASGEMTPFTLNIGSASQKAIITVIGEKNGAMHYLDNPASP